MESVFESILYMTVEEEDFSPSQDNARLKNITANYVVGKGHSSMTENMFCMQKIVGSTSKFLKKLSVGHCEEERS